jgi:CHASE2 domain-containing sensor protein
MKCMSMDGLDSGLPTTETVRSVLLLVFGFVLFAYSAALWTDMITFTPPAVVYLVGGIGLVAYGISKMRQS